MWYVMQVYTGREERMRDLCLDQIEKPLLEDCFIPMYEQMKKYEGAWHKERKKLFPGYLILVTDQIYEVIIQLRKVDGFKRVLGDMECLQPLSEAEMALLRRLCGEKQVVEMSVGVIENDKVEIISGPMKGLEGCIRKIDRHKRIAKIEVDMFGRVIEATVGVEIVRKVSSGESIDS